MGLIPDAHEKMQQMIVGPQRQGILAAGKVHPVRRTGLIALGDGGEGRRFRALEGVYCFFCRHEMPFSAVHEEQIRQIFVFHPPGNQFGHHTIVIDTLHVFYPVIPVPSLVWKTIHKGDHGPYRQFALDVRDIHTFDGSRGPVQLQEGPRKGHQILVPEFRPGLQEVQGIGLCHLDEPHLLPPLGEVDGDSPLCQTRYPFINGEKIFDGFGNQDMLRNKGFSVVVLLEEGLHDLRGCAPLALELIVPAAREVAFSNKKDDDLKYPVHLFEADDI